MARGKGGYVFHLYLVYYSRSFIMSGFPSLSQDKGIFKDLPKSGFPEYMKNRSRSQSKEDFTRLEKGKQTQASRSGEKALRIVPTIIGRPEPTQSQEEKEKRQKRIEERISSSSIASPLSISSWGEDGSNDRARVKTI
ncbi:hypothetical protein PanWU01x14_103700, partial [Parasponia andersonii]